MQSSTANEFLFFLIDGIERSTEFLAAAGLYLGKNKSLPVTADEINFPSPWSTKVLSEDLPALSLEMESCFSLSPLAESDVILRARRRSDRPVQNLGDDAGKGHILSA